MPDNETCISSLRAEQSALVFCLVRGICGWSLIRPEATGAQVAYWLQANLTFGRDTARWLRQGTCRGAPTCEIATRLRHTLPEPPIQQCSPSELARAWPQPPASVQIHRRSVLQALAAGVVVYMMLYHLSCSAATAFARPSSGHRSDPRPSCGRSPRRRQSIRP